MDTALEVAINKAIAAAKRLDENIYIIDDEGYVLTTREGLDTYYEGYEPVRLVYPTGEVE